MPNGKVGPAGTFSSGWSRAMTLVVVLASFLLTILPVVDASTEIIFVDPSPSETVKGVMTVEVRMDAEPTKATLNVDDMYFSDMTSTGYMGGFWHYEYDLDTWGLADGGHLLRVDAVGTVDQASRGIVFFVDNYAPTIGHLEVKYPDGQDAAKKKDRLTITAEVSDDVSGVMEVHCDASKLQAPADLIMFDDGQHNDTIENDGIYGTASFTTDALTNGYNIAYVSAVDGMGNTARKALPVAFDNNPPLLEDAVVDYPLGQRAAKLGDELRITARVEDKGEGGLLRIGTDIVLVLDNSGSMINGMDPPMDDLKEAVSGFVDLMHPQDRLAIYGFSNNDNYPYLYEDSKRYLGFTKMDEDGKQDVKDILNYSAEFNMAHNTPIWDTIGDAIQYSISDSEHQPVVVAITDGTDYGYDWYERPNPNWWEEAYAMGYTGLGFERGSERYCPWHDWGSTLSYSYHYGEYPAPWPEEDEVHSFNVPLVDNNTFNYSQEPGMDEDRDSSSPLRKGLLNAPVPVYTIGLDLLHHVPIQSNTTEYDLFRIATTSNNQTVRAKYYHTPDPEDLADIYEEISSFIDLAGDLNITPPGGVRSFLLDAASIGVENPKVMHDDGENDDMYPHDEVFGSEMFQVDTDLTERIPVDLRLEDIVGHEKEVQVEILVDNTKPVIEGLRAHHLDPEDMVEIERGFGSDGDHVFFTANVSDEGNVSGIMRVLLDTTPLGGDREVPMRDDGEDFDDLMGDGVYTSGGIEIGTGGMDGLVEVEALAFDVANNTDSDKGDLLVLNSLDIEGHIVSPLNGTYVRGENEIRMALNDYTNVVSANVLVTSSEGAPGPGSKNLTMVKDEETGLYRVMWNTTDLNDGEYRLDGRVFTKADTIIDVGPLVVKVDNTPPEVGIVEPEEGSVVLVTTNIEVMARDPGWDYPPGSPPAISVVEYRTDSGKFEEMNWDPDREPPFRAILDPTLLKDGDHTVEVRAIDLAGWTSLDEMTFYVDTGPPEVEPVYIPPTDQDISGDFNFGFKVVDVSGIEEGGLVLDDGDENYTIIKNPRTGLYEVRLNTTFIDDGNHTYCAIFKDRVGLETTYCSVFRVNNTVPPKPPDRDDSDLFEMPWWMWLIVAVAMVITGLALVAAYRERRMRDEMEGEMMDMEGEKELLDKGPPDDPDPGTEDPDGNELPPELPDDYGEGKRRNRRGMGSKADLLVEDEGGEQELYEPAGVEALLSSGRVGERSEEAEGEKGISKGLEEDGEAPEGDGDKRDRAGPRYVRCPICKSKTEVESDERPLLITCRFCGARGRLK